MGEGVEPLEMAGVGGLYFQHQGPMEAREVDAGGVQPEMILEVTRETVLKLIEPVGRWVVGVDERARSEKPAVEDQTSVQWRLN
jgi:hypothetical protein